MFENKIVLLMRHGEKYFGELSDDGIHRANFLPEYFLNYRPEGVKFPTVVIAMKPKHKFSSTRCVDTALPLVKAFNLPFIVEFTIHDTKKLIDYIKKMNYSVFFIIWEHVCLVQIAKALGAPVKNWNSTPISCAVDTKSFNILWKIERNTFESFNTFDVKNKQISHFMFPKKELYKKFII